MRILIAEHDHTTRRLLEVTLCKVGFEIEMYSDCKTAWQALQRDNAPDLVILDWLMPDIGGSRICRQLRTMNPYCYLILLTSKEQQRATIAGLEAGANDYITKPFSPLELKARLSTGVRLLRLQQEVTASHNAMRDMMKHDVLTGLWNHSTIVEMLEAETLRASQCCRESVGIILADIDHLQQINDSYGHKQGDQVLCAVAHHIHAENRGFNIVGRYSGDMFIIILPCCDEAEAQGFATRLTTRIAGAPLSVGDHSIEYSISMGITIFDPEDYRDVALLIHQAQQALVRARSVPHTEPEPLHRLHPSAEAGGRVSLRNNHA